MSVAEEGNSKRAIIAAFAANLGIAVSKFVAFLFTGSSALLAEAVHSVADTANQLLLLVGGRRAKREASSLHPFGYQRFRYFYGFLVTLVIFLVGGVFALFEGWEKLRAPEPVESPVWAFVVLGVVDRAGVLLAAHRGARGAAVPARAAVAAVHQDHPLAGAAGRARRGLRRADRPGVRLGRDHPRRRHRRRAVGRGRHHRHRRAAGRHLDHPVAADAQPADRRVRRPGHAAADRGRDRGRARWSSA